MLFNGETLLEKFDDVVRQFSEHGALLFNEQQISYGQLQSQSKQLACYLSQHHGIKPNQRIGLMLDPSPMLVTAIFAILRLGCCYVPIHSEYPAQRVDSMVDSAGLSLILTGDDTLLNRLDIAFEIPQMSLLGPTDENILEQYQQQMNESTECYLIYTSGSTGEPKGVPVSNQNLMERFCSTSSLFDFDEQDVWMLFHSPAFDFSIWEIFASITHGSKLLIVNEAMRRMPWMVVDLVYRYGVTVLCQTPSYFSQLLMAMTRIESEVAHQLRYIIFGGEAINLASVAQWFDFNGYNHGDTTELVNMYGITETTIHVTHKVLTPEGCTKGINNIGKPLGRTHIRLLDEDLNDVVAGEKGEIAVHGYGVSKGYINAPSQTESKFVHLPLCTDTSAQQGKQSALHYLSGDIGRLLEDGNIEYCGRKDRQVKVAGHRIELGEIENVANSHAAVVSSHVFNMKVDNTMQLSLFCEGVAGKALTAKQLSDFLSVHLPHYMIPPFIEIMASLPITVNGKVDSVKLKQIRNRQ